MNQKTQKSLIKKLKNHLHNKRHFTLLEVLIAFFLITLCVLPLMTPYIFMYRAQQDYVREIELDRLEGLIYADMLQKLYHKEIPWEDILHEREAALEENQVADILAAQNYKKPFPWDVSYQFTIEKDKINQEGKFEVYIVNITLKFKPKGVTDEKKTLKYLNKVLLIREKSGVANEEEPK